MKYSRGQFNSENYKLWQKGFVLAQPSQGSVYKVLYTKSSISSCSSITLKAFSILDALERACYETTYSSTFRPEEIDLLAVFDADENLVWIDEPYYIVLQKKHEFRGIERREFLRIFGGFSVLSLFALKSPFAWGASTTVNFAGTSVGFTTESIFSTPGTFNWTVPIGVTSISFVCVGAGGKNAQAGGGVGTDNVGSGAAGGGGNSGGGNGGGPGVGKNGSHTIQVDGCSNPYYGAGAGGDGNSIYGGARPAGTGAVRIIWGVGKSFPTNAS